MAELIKQLDQQMEASASARLDPLRSALGLKFRHDYAPVSRHYVSSASFAQIISLWDQQSIKHADDMERRVGRCWINNPVPYGGECFEPYDMPDPKCSAIDPADLWAEDVGVPASLPAGVVPDIVERVAQDQARRLGVEAGAPAATFLTTLGSLVPARNRLQMRQNNPHWTVPPITWTAVIAIPGSNKSATIDSAMAPIYYVEREWRREYALAKRAFDEQAGQADKKAEAPTSTDTVFPDSPTKPHCRRKIIEDVTVEAIASLLVKNADGLICHSDELAGFFGGMDAYRAKGGKNRPFWLKTKDGRPHTVDRRNSDSISVETTAVSILGGIPPAKIKALAAGLSDDGLLQRFLPVLLNRIGNGVDVAPDVGLEDGLKQLAINMANSESKRLFKFAPEADGELCALENFKTREIERPGASSVLQQWLDKLPNEFGRFALIMHFIEWYSGLGSLLGEPPPELVSRDTAARARRYLMEFAFSHARAFYGPGGSEVDEHAKWIAGYILARGIREIDERDVYRAYPRLRKPDDRWGIQNAMRSLEMQGWAVATKERKGKDTAWRINSAVHDGRFAQIAERERTRRGGFGKRSPMKVKQKLRSGAKTEVHAILSLAGTGLSPDLALRCHRMSLARARQLRFYLFY